MFCSNCGTQLADAAVICPNCGVAVAGAVSPAAKPKKKRTASKGAKSYAAIFTALMVFPAMICTVWNLVREHDTFWAGYVLGALAVVWVYCVLPVLRITPAPITALICFVTTSLYLLYIAKQSGHFELFYAFAMPLTLLLSVYAAMDYALIGGKRIDGVRIFSLLSLQSAVFFIVLEALIDNFKRGAIDLKWSLVVSCGFVSALALSEAVSYITRLYKKQ